MTTEQLEAFDAVQKINEELYAKYSKIDKLDEYPILSITFADNMTFISLSPSSIINLPEIHLYNSVNDDRIFYEKSNKYETFYKFIKRKFILVKEEIYAIKL